MTQLSNYQHIYSENPTVIEKVGWERINLCFSFPENDRLLLLPYWRFLTCCVPQVTSNS